MTKSKASQKDYWNDRAEKFDELSAPLIPGKQDVNFMRRYLVQDGRTLILGVTSQLCTVAQGISKDVTAVDFAEGMILALRQEGINYICMDWNEYLEQTTEKFDNILTDGGLTCIGYPETWQRLSANIRSRLKPNGVFAARAFINTGRPPKDNYDNPNLTRFITSMGRVDHNWMLKIESHDDYRDYDISYAFPTEKKILETFSNLTLLGKFIPDYEAGEHFVSYAWGLS